MEPALSRNVVRWRRAFFVLLLLGATLGAALDGIHTHFGATRYANPIVLRMAWWVPLLFGGAFCIGLLRPILDLRLRRELSPRPTRAKMVLGVALFVLAYFLTVAPLPWPTVAGLLTAIFLFGWWRCDGSALGLYIALGAAIGGPLFEMSLIASGAFVHLHPVYLHVPGWLPFLYLCAAVGLTTLARFLIVD